MDRRTIWAILLMMAIAVAPAIFMKKPPNSGAPGQPGSRADSSAISTRSGVDTVRGGRSTARDTAKAPAAPEPRPSARPAAPLPTSAGDDTVRVSSPLYHYAISTRGARLVEATLSHYRSMAPQDRGQPAQILSADSRLLGLTLVLGRDTISLADWPFTVSAESLVVSGPTPLRLSATRSGVTVDLTYTFRPDDYQIGVSGQVTGVGPNGGLLARRHGT